MVTPYSWPSRAGRLLARQGVDVGLPLAFQVLPILGVLLGYRMRASIWLSWATTVPARASTMPVKRSIRSSIVIVAPSVKTDDVMLPQLLVTDQTLCPWPVKRICSISSLCYRDPVAIQPRARPPLADSCAPTPLLPAVLGNAAEGEGFDGPERGNRRRGAAVMELALESRSVSGSDAPRAPASGARLEVEDSGLSMRCRWSAGNKCHSEGRTDGEIGFGRNTESV